MKYIKYSFLLVIAVVMSSCLKKGLEDLPAFDKKNITGVAFVQYRFIGDKTSNASNQQVVEFKDLEYEQKELDTLAGLLKFDVKVPKVTSTFTEKHREECAVNNIVVGVNLDPASRISPLEGAPKLGVPGDWSKPNKYKVTAADGSTKEWTIEVVKFTK